MTDTINSNVHRNVIKNAGIQVMILLKYKESVPDRTKITVGFGTTGVHISYMPVLPFYAIMV